jgi:DNA-binding IclR family transcriptional regulator
MLLHEISSHHNLRITGESKWASPIYVGATAKVLLSQLDDKELNTTVKNIKFDHVTGSAVNERENLMEQIKEIRRQGYCVSFGERIPGAICISAPINNYNYPASLNILGPESRLGSIVSELIEELKASATYISQDITPAFKEKEVIEVI